MRFIILTCLVAYAAADVSHVVNSQEKKANIVKQSLELSPEGAYVWVYETSNGINAGQQGVIINSQDQKSTVLRTEGAASWTSPEGQKVDLTYVADENGYQPQGSHLPTPPPIPEAILRSLEYIRDHPPQPDRK